MLENPTFGWCGMTIGSWHINNASYLEDYPIMFSDALLWSLGYTEGHDFPVDGNCPKRCLVLVDCEGDWWTVGMGPDGLDIWHGDPDDNPDPVFSELVYSEQMTPRRLRGMCRELARDIEGCLHEWTMWGTDAAASVDEAEGDYDKAEDYIRRKEDLEKLVDELRRA